MTDGGPHILSINGGHGAWQLGTVSERVHAIHLLPQKLRHLHSLPLDLELRMLVLKKEVIWGELGIRETAFC